MSSRAARKRRTQDDRIDEAVKEGNRAYIHKAKRFVEQASQITGGAGSGASFGALTPGTGVLQTSGDTMDGSIAFRPLPIFILDGRLDITPDQSGNSKSSTYVLATGQGSPDDLHFIDGADKNGQLLYLQGTETQVIILKAATMSLITSISGLGTVLVQTLTNHNLTTGDKINILGTTNFNISNVSVTVTNSTEFTYLATGNIIPESTGLVQNGNIVTRDGNDIVIDGTISPNGIPVIALLFDPTVEGFGAWRPQSGDIGSGGGVSFPIDFPEEDRGTVGSSTEVIDFTQSDRHAVIMELNGDIGISLTNTTVGTLQISTIKLRQDGTGGHAFTGFTQAVANEQAIIDAAAAASGAGEFVVFVVRSLDGLFTAFLEDSNIITGGGGGLNTNLSNMVSPTLPPVDLNMNQHNILGVTGIDLDGISATIQGIVNLEFNQSGQSITEKADPDGGLLYSVADLQAHIFKSGADDIAQFEESAAGVFQLDMLGHAVKDAKHFALDNASGATTFVGNVPAIGFDSVAAKLLINFPTGAVIGITENNVIGSTEIGSNEIEATFLTAEASLLIGGLGGAPVVSGQFTNDGVDTFVFSGGAIRNLSDISAGLNTNLSNMVSPTLPPVDLNMNQHNILGVTGIDLDGISATIQGIKELRFFDDDPNKNIQSAANEVSYNTPALDQHSFYVGGHETLRIVESSASQYDLNVLDSRISAIGDAAFSLNGGNIILNRFSMEYDNVALAARINVPVGDQFRFQEGGTTVVSFVPFASIGYTIQDSVGLFLDDAENNPLNNGEIQRNGTDVFVFSGNALRNMSNIGAGSPLTTKGDLFGFDTVNARIPVGSNGQVLTANSAVALGVEWTAAGSNLLPLNNVWTGFNTFTNQVNLNANVNIGDETSDIITGISRLERDWIPDSGDNRNLGDTTNNWAASFVGRTNLISGGVLTGVVLVNANGIEINSPLAGDFVELKTQGIDRARFAAEADGGIVFFEPLEINDNMRIDGGNMIHANDGVECGFAVTDDIITPGSFGTIQIPVNPGNILNAANADADFGDAVGCIGMYREGVGTPTLVIKIDTSPSTWAILVLSVSGNISAGRLT